MSAALVARLVETSARDSRRGSHLRWPLNLDAQEWCFSPEWVSLYGTAAFSALDEDRRRRLAFYEAVNFFSLNLHGEGPLIEGLTRRTEAARGAWAEYEGHFLAEERKHTGWFREFCERYAGRVYPERKLVLPRATAPGEDELVFFAQALVFEEVVDAYDACMGRDSRLAPIVRRIHALHHRDECRHRAFGRHVVRELWARSSPAWSAEVVARVQGRLDGYFDAVWFDYYNPDVYRDAGLLSPIDVRREAWASAFQRDRRARLLAPIRRFLAGCGILPKRGDA